MLAPTFYHNFFRKEFNAAKFCSIIGACDFKFVKDSTQEYIDNVLKGKPKYNPPKINSNVPSYRFLFFTDVHADKKYMEVCIQI